MAPTIDNARRLPPGERPGPTRVDTPDSGSGFKNVPYELPPGSGLQKQLQQPNPLTYGEKWNKSLWGIEPRARPAPELNKDFKAPELNNPGNGFTNGPIPDSDSFVKPQSNNSWGTGKNVFASKHNSIFPHEVIKELRQMAGLDDEEVTNEVKAKAEPEMPDEKYPKEKDSDDSFTKDPGKNTDPGFNKEIEESTRALAWMRTLAGLDKGHG
jgi:hypothetical protein